MIPRSQVLYTVHGVGYRFEAPQAKADEALRSNASRSYRHRTKHKSDNEANSRASWNTPRSDSRSGLSYGSRMALSFALTSPDDGAHTGMRHHGGVGQCFF